MAGSFILGITVVAPGVTWLAAGGPTRESSGLVALSALDDSVLARPRVVALDINAAELEELRAHPYERGRNWERVGAVAVLENGALQYEARAGVRVHGGGSRGRSEQSLRLYLRAQLQAEGIPGRVIGLDENIRYRSLVLHNDFRFDNDSLIWHYLNPLAYDLGRRLGVPVVRTAPASLVVNGGPSRPFVIAESLNLDWLEARYGHREFLMLETKDAMVLEAIRRQGPLAELRTRFGEPAQWTLANVQEVVDTDNLARWFMLVLFCGTRDALQGKMVRDLSRPEARWFWVAWDMDLSFARKHEGPGPSWEFDSFVFWLDSDQRGPDTDARIVLVRQLLQSSAEFRSEFLQLYQTARDSLLTPAFLGETLARYEGAADVYGITDVEYRGRVRDFLLRRPAAVGELLQRRFQMTIPAPRSIP